MIASGAVLGDRYHVVELIAHGGMADVFRARDGRLERDVAVKAFRVGAADVRRFQAETRILAGFDHPNLVRVLDAGEHDEHPYLVLELVDGPTLAHRLGAGPLPEGEVRRLGRDLSAALAHVHAARVVHRDVKPSNVLLASDGRALLGDFGIALLLDATRLTVAEGVPGTAAYLAPEQAGGGDVTPATDIYSLGLVLLEALTGERAFRGTPQEVMAARLTRPPVLPAEMPEPWVELLGAMTALDPAARPAAAAVQARLGSADTAPTMRAQPAPAGPAGWSVVPGGADDGPTVVAPTAVADQERTAGAERTQVLPGGPPRARRRRGFGSLAAGFAAIAVLVMAMALAGPDDPDVGAPPGTTTTVPSTTATPSAPSPSTAPAASPAGGGAEAPPAAECNGLEAAKQGIEAETQRLEEQYRNNPAVRDLLKQQLETQRQEIERQKQAAGC